MWRRAISKLQKLHDVTFVRISSKQNAFWHVQDNNCTPGHFCSTTVCNYKTVLAHSFNLSKYCSFCNLVIAIGKNLISVIFDYLCSNHFKLYICENEKWYEKIITINQESYHSCNTFQNKCDIILFTLLCRIIDINKDGCHISTSFHCTKIKRKYFSYDCCHLALVM